MTDDPEIIRETAMRLLAARQPGATICPSEIARALTAPTDDGAEAWRDAMPSVHAAVDRLVADGIVTLSWKGEPLASRSGPYRIARAEPD